MTRWYEDPKWNQWFNDLDKTYVREEHEVRSWLRRQKITTSRYTKVPLLMKNDNTMHKHEFAYAWDLWGIPFSKQIEWRNMLLQHGIKVSI